MRHFILAGFIIAQITDIPYDPKNVIIVVCQDKIPGRCSTLKVERVLLRDEKALDMMAEHFKKELR